VATLSIGDDHARTQVAGRSEVPAWQRVAIGAAAGVMPVLISLAVVQAAPAVDAVKVLLQGGHDSASTASNALATLLGLAVLAAGLSLAGVLSALWQARQVERLGLFQTSLVAPALLFVLVQAVGMLGTPRAGEDGDTGAQILVTGMTAGDGTPVRIVVYKRQAPNPTGCFVQGLRGRGC